MVVNLQTPNNILHCKIPNSDHLHVFTTIAKIDIM